MKIRLLVHKLLGSREVAKIACYFLGDPKKLIQIKQMDMILAGVVTLGFMFPVQFWKHMYVWQNLVTVIN
jgi:hypothetical protein